MSKTQSLLNKDNLLVNILRRTQICGLDQMCVFEGIYRRRGETHSNRAKQKHRPNRPTSTRQAIRLSTLKLKIQSRQHRTGLQLRGAEFLTNQLSQLAKLKL